MAEPPVEAEIEPVSAPAEPAEPIFAPSEHLALHLARLTGRLELYRAARAGDTARAAGLDLRLARFDRELEMRVAASDVARLPIEQLRHRFALGDVAIDLLLAAAVPGLDHDLARELAALGDDPRRPCSVGQLLAILAPTEIARRTAIADLADTAPLVRYRLVRVVPTAGAIPDEPLLLAALAVPERVISWLRGETHFEGVRYERSTRLVGREPGVTLDPVMAAQLDRVIFRVDYAPEDAASLGRLPTVIAGSSLSGKRSAALAVAGARGRTTVDVDLSRLVLAADPVDALRDIAREACLHDALLLLRRAEVLLEPARAALRNAAATVMADGRLWVVLTTGADPADLLRLVARTQLVRLDLPSETAQLRLWEQVLPRTAQITAAQLVARYHMTPGDIIEAAASAVGEAGKRGPGEPVTTVDVIDAVRSRFRHRLTDVADVVVTTIDWSDIVLRDDIFDRVVELMSVVRHNKTVMDDWGFGRRFSYGRGLSALFSGPPGTGKTMIAGLIAKELGLELFRVDLSRVVSKWVGETEKNLGRAFDEASNARAILLFDEADALFGKRTEVRSSNDRYANLETNYLLQRVETFEGIVLLTTNRDTSIDEAFRRRLRFRIEIPAPEVAERERLWRTMIPAAAPLAPGVSFRSLAERFAMTGGYIKNAAMRAAFLAAASEKRIISQGLLERAAALEWEEMGKL